MRKDCFNYFVIVHELGRIEWLVNYDGYDDHIN